MITTTPVLTPLTPRGMLIFSCFALVLLAVLIALNYIEGAMFERILYLFSGYLMRDYAGNRRQMNERIDALVSQKTETQKAVHSSE